MAKTHLIILVSSLLLSLAFADEYVVAKPGQKSVEVVVEGVVYCQSCELSGTGSLTGAVPLPAATVSVTCRDEKSRVSFYKAFEADEEGYFFGELKGYKMTHEYVDHPLQACKVKLVGSPNEKCSLLSNVNDGINGAPLRFEGKRFVAEKYETVIYGAGPLAFRPNYCPKETHY